VSDIDTDTYTAIPSRFLETLKPHLPYAGSDALTAADDLAALGLDSMGVVRLLVDLEENYELDLPDELLTEETFSTVGSLWTTVAGLVAAERIGGE
jgi:acyl carrier protein